MKNIEFYHDEIIENRYFHSIFEFAKEKGKCVFDKLHFEYIDKVGWH